MINIRSVSVYVDDQELAIEFWVKKVGFELIKDMPMGPNMRWIEVSPHNSQTVLVLYPKQGIPNHEDMKPSVVFECDNIDRTYVEMSNNGVRFDSKPRDMGFSKFATFYDESSNIFGLKE